MLQSYSVNEPSETEKLKLNRLFLRNLINFLLVNCLEGQAKNSLNCLTVADPGSGRGGGKHFSRDSADEVKQANIGQGPGPALGPWKLLHF